MNNIQQFEIKTKPKEICGFIFLQCMFQYYHLIQFIIIQFYKRISNMQKNSSNLIFVEYLPEQQSLPQSHRIFFKQLTNIKTRSDLKQAYKNYKKYLLTQDQPVKKEIVINYLQNSIIAEGVLGNIQFKFSSFQLLKLIAKQIPFDNVNIVLKNLSCLDHYRNFSQLLELFSQNVKEQKQFSTYFVIPLIQTYKNAVSKVQSQSFSCKWLEVFIEITRSLNNLIRQNLSIEHYKQQIILLTKKCLGFTTILRRDIITQLYLILLALDKEEPQPINNLLNLIHYLHSRAILFNQKILSRLLEYTSIPETELKFHVLYALVFSIQKQFPTYEKKQEVFDKIVNLYQIGRTAYSVLEEIIKIIIKFNGSWVLSGYLSRKFFLAKCILKSIANQNQVLAKWPNLFEQSLQYSGNLNTPFAIDCVEILLEKFYVQSKENPEEWTKYWIKPYLKFLQEGDRLTVRGIIQQVNPVITRLCKQPILLKHLLEFNSKESINIKLGIISLLKCYKENGLIFPNQENNSYFYRCNSKDTKENKSLTKIEIEQQNIRVMLISNDTNISLKSLEFITITQKPTDPILPFEYKLMLTFFRYSLRSSSSDFRRSYLNAVRKLFERIRLIYQKQIGGSTKKFKPVPYLQEFKNFLNQLIKFCFENLYPDVPFEIINPILEILFMIFNYFGIYDYQIRKGTNISGSKFLLSFKNIFTLQNFNALTNCLQSSFQNVRNLAFNIINLFPLQFTQHEEIVKLWDESLKLTNKLIIRQFQSGARLINFIYKRYHIHLPNIEKKSTLLELNLYYFLLGLMKQKFQVFKKEFETQTEQFNSNLLHGINTCFSYLFEELSHNIKFKKETYLPYVNQIKTFFENLFNFLKDAITFAVEISSANVSTVVLDSSQSKLAESSNKKMKVDCRGHFIKENQIENEKNSFMKNIENMLSGATLMTSITPEDDQSIQNTLVVSFYLLTRQSGLLFQSIASLAQNDHYGYLSQKSLIEIINIYFYALVNLKHMGSVDRISQGLQKMAKAIYKKQENQLNSLPETLLNKLLQLLQENKFTNILRRSAGIPYAFTCLLKSEALRRKHLVENTINKLFHFAKCEDEEIKQLRIHSFNILKKIFQDADLKFDLDPFVSEAFILSIKGFGTQEWGVRNSSLMLFSTLALRTLGTVPKLNLLQFFQKCPSLIEFFLEELKSYIKVKTMYPPIYPITLLLSRLVPFDKSPSPYKLDTIEKQSRLLNREQLKIFIPLLLEAGNTANYMGRVMIGKALLPFLDVNQILQFCIQILQPLSLKQIKKNHNRAHSNLLIVYNLMRSYYKIIDLQITENEKILNSNEINFFKILSSLVKLLEGIKCPLVAQMIVKIAYKFIKKVHNQLEKHLEEKYIEFIKYFNNFSTKYLKQNLYNLKNFKFQHDFGNSILRLAIIKLTVRLNVQFRSKNIEYSTFIDILTSIQTNAKKNLQYFNQIDNEVIELYLSELKRFSKRYRKINNIILKKLYEPLLLQVAFSQDVVSSVLSKILDILKYFKPIFSAEQVQILFRREKKSLNPHFKIAIYKALSKSNINVRHLFQIYSKPEELLSFRAACVKSIKVYNSSEAIIYIRLLEDQDPQIRKYTADKLSQLLKIPQYNEQKIKQIIVLQLSNDQINKLIEDGDIEIKRRNNIEQRIFSYDKPNKYRSDILNLIQISKKIKEIDPLQNGENYQKLFKKYKTEIFSRNQYKFEVVLRNLIKRINNAQTNEQKIQVQKQYTNLNPLITKLIHTLIIEQQQSQNSQ